MTATMRMTGDIHSVGAARSLVRTFTANDNPVLADTAVLLTDELVNNAVLHGGGRFTLSVTRRPPGLRISVLDATTGVPLLLPHSPDREDGRGMMIVDALAARWGVSMRKQGKAVWFELLADAPGATDHPPDTTSRGPMSQAQPVRSGA